MWEGADSKTAWASNLSNHHFIDLKRIRDKTQSGRTLREIMRFIIKEMKYRYKSGGSRILVSNKSERITKYLFLKDVESTKTKWDFYK